MTTLLGIDVGTTTCKAGWFREDGTAIRVARTPTPTRWAQDGSATYEPDELWSTVSALITDALHPAADGEEAGPPCCVGITSMAETGLLIDRATRVPRGPLYPWFDTTCAQQAERIARADDRVRRFCASGIHPSPKMGLAKILWLKDQNARLLDNAVWLSVSDYIAFRLTGAFATDPTLAARTYAYGVDRRAWDAAWVRQFDVPDALFPDVLPSGSAMGTVTQEASERTSLMAGTPVAVCGHDHLSAALAVGVVHPGPVLDSMGTTETLVGVLEQRALTAEDAASGLAFGPHIVPGWSFWMGGTPASGASVEWLRSQMDDVPVSYEALDALLARAPEEPTGLLYFPYLRGRGAPLRNPLMRAAFVGLDDSHGRPHLVKAVLEGTAYELESMLRCAEGSVGAPIALLRGVGGGTRNRGWMQIKSDISGSRYEVPGIPEAAALGAALAAAIGQGVYASAEAASETARAAHEGQTFEPASARHHDYQTLYQGAYLPFQTALAEHFGRVAGLIAWPP